MIRLQVDWSAALIDQLTDHPMPASQ